MTRDAECLVARFARCLVLEYRAIRYLLDQSGSEEWRWNTQRQVAFGGRRRKIRLRELAVGRIGAAGDGEHRSNLAAWRAVFVVDESGDAHRTIGGNKCWQAVAATILHHECDLGIQRRARSAARGMR